MSLPVESALASKDRLWPAVLASLAIHAALVVWGLSRREGPEIDLEQKPIVAKLVRLGQKKPEEWLPRKDAAPPPAPAPEVAAAPAVPSAPPAPAAHPTTARVPAARPAQPAGPAPRTAGTGTSLASVLSRVRQEQVQYGSPEGDPQGDSDTGSEGDRYLALVQRALHASYRVPATLSERERMFLKAEVVLYVEPDGRIARWKLEKPSGNGAFDNALERTLRDTRLPPPPDALREQYRTRGIAVRFEI